MKKVIFLAIISLFVSSMAFGSFVNDWTYVMKPYYPSGMDKNVYVNITDDFVAYAEICDYGVARAMLFNAAGQCILNHSVESKTGKAAFAWSRLVKNQQVTRYNLYVNFTEWGSSVPAGSGAILAVASGWRASNYLM